MVVWLLLISMAVPVGTMVGTVTIVAPTSIIVSSWEVATPSAPVVLKGPPVATVITTVITTIALEISRRIVPLPAM